MEYQQEEIMAKPFDWKIMKRLLTYAKPYWFYILIGVIAILLVTVSNLLRPYLVQQAIDNYINNPHISKEQAIQGVIRIGSLYIVIITVAFLINYGQVYLIQYTGQKIIFNLRQQIFEHLQKLSLSFFDRNPVGRLVTRVTNDTDTLNEMYTSVITNLFNDVFIIAGIVIAMVSYNLKLAFIALSTTPLILTGMYIYRKLASQAYRLVRVRLARINAFLSEHISGMKIVQLFVTENKKMEEFKKINKEYYDANMRQLTIFAIFRPSMDVIYSLTLALLIWYGGRDIIAGKIEFGVLYAFVNYLQQLFQPIFDISEKYDILQSAMASAERIFILLDTKEEVKDPENPIPLEEVKGKIEFKNVWFSYNGKEWVLKDVSFEVNPGETVAFVGATGAGKTSIINLLCRFYDIQKGEILIDGIDIRKVRQQDLRKHIGIVLQDVFLFTGDIKSNIRLNNKNITDNDIYRVAKYVNAHQFIKKLPEGYNSKVTERGSTLSAGQRQLLAFARALAFNPKILVLDEATANIDTETERLIQDALEKLTKGRTTLVIAHRLSTIQHADKIIVLHKGRIREIGTHQELLQKKGLYYNLYMLQYKDQLSESKIS
ncbi:MAG: ABC-type multidrug/protein/lipid transport system, ATPase component [Caldanaerobacter subterraneus]|uniref:ATP-binding cassette subfamily B protein n=1 Tax=Caldanaerobacter subterraneus TaxID=911092 RepID=A0A101E4K6_9THEO|nr:ABC transporter ATP-binding protein [Caldanaerobacter subterraneus]KUK08728.1 MAG: ABC-type multidrug/protein/lipid transport system, ATPase component [Caldanaerobacter subterraneus]MDK2793505.1 ATP-binding cassette, subfamily multidrug efflux pump [Caldanaerobacter sp.]TCO68031.1 ATP-binding cassette subfamily B protein [Caldanaerobacter subterraneus]HBT48642.1 antibiotic ABC transporter ATP-binding protein [Caldanaerobacter subterraneus]